MGCNSLIPKKFLCCFDLAIGSLITGIFMTCIMVICGICLIAQLLAFEDCDHGSNIFFLWKNAYCLRITAIIYCIFLVAVNIWFIFWGVKKEKSSVVLGWVVITAMWQAQTFCFLLVLLIMYLHYISLVVLILSLVFGLLGVCILLYGLLIGYGYWLELKNKARHATTNTSNS